MSELRDGARKLLDASIHAVHCMNSMRTAPDGVPDGIYTFRLFAAMDALETAINECGPALSEPDPRDAVDVPSAEALECAIEVLGAEPFAYQVNNDNARAVAAFLIQIGSLKETP